MTLQLNDNRENGITIPPDTAHVSQFRFQASRDAANDRRDDFQHAELMLALGSVLESASALAPLPAVGLQSGTPFFLQKDLGSCGTPGTQEIDGDFWEHASTDQILLPNSGNLPESRAILSLASMPVRQLLFPKSQYSGYIPPLQVSKERIAVKYLLADFHSIASGAFDTESLSGSDEFDQIELSNYSIYLPGSVAYHPFEMRGLQYLHSIGCPYLLLDGILSVGESRQYVQGVAFKTCSIGNYGQENHAVGSEIWIQSQFNSKSNVYYKLGAPSTEYSRFHENFVWLANLAKHFVDYCQASSSPISIHNFRKDFFIWTQKIHGDSVDFQKWYSAYESKDFRHAICRNIEFLHKESVGVDERLKGHPIWSEIFSQNSIKEQKLNESRTLVTPYVYECFKHLQFGEFLEAVVDSVKDVRSRQVSLGRSLHLTTADSLQPNESKAQHLKAQNQHLKVLDTAETISYLARKVQGIEVGDVVAVTKDTETVWKDEISKWKVADHCWYFLILDIHTDQRGERSFHGIWLYKPSDTFCAKMKYPYANELFLSDNCTCGNVRIAARDILDVIDVEWHGQPSTSRKFFIRQTYLGNDQFITLREEHKRCLHFKNNDAPEPFDSLAFDYPVGQSVLVIMPRQKRPKHALEVFEILDYIKDDTSTQTSVLLRQLQRRSDFDGQGKPNELIYTNICDKVDANKIYSTCLVRYFHEDESIPAPYNRGGAGNAFYITHERVEVGDNGKAKLVPLASCPQGLVQGFHPGDALKKLRGLDIFCGGGNFGRGLEDGCAVENCYAVDLDKAAIHSYSANLHPESKTKLFYGSVDDLLRAAMKGNPDGLDSVPLVGDVDFISAGSPCQGFSLLNNNKNNAKGLRNQSLVASVAAFVDYYRPKYGLLENVISMAQKGRGRDEDVLSQLAACLVGMGYQARIILLDAWSSGSPQSRSRLFVSFAAPGMTSLEHPSFSHSHPPTTSGRGLGKLANGQAFGSRDLNVLTPFNFVSASQGVKDLPIIEEGATGYCIRFPDHLLDCIPTEQFRSQIQAIPLYPRGSNFAKAWNEGNGSMSQEERLHFPKNSNRRGHTRAATQPSSKAWGRVHPDKLFGTITATMCTASARGAPTLHWNENRKLTLQEYRRAQSFPDEEIIVGSRSQCLKIIGNSVARTVAVALGLKLREAWVKSGTEDRLSSQHVATVERGSTDTRMQELPQHSCPLVSQSPNPVQTISSDQSVLIDSPVTDTDADSDIRELVNSRSRRPPEDRLLSISLTARQKSSDETVFEEFNSLKRAFVSRDATESSTSVGETSVPLPKDCSRLSNPSEPPEKKLKKSPTTNDQNGIRQNEDISAEAPRLQEKVVIVISDSEEEDSVMLVPRPAYTPYKPVDNSLFSAYAKTKGYMKYKV